MLGHVGYCSVIQHVFWHLGCPSLVISYNGWEKKSGMAGVQPCNPEISSLPCVPCLKVPKWHIVIPFFIGFSDHRLLWSVYMNHRLILSKQCMIILYKANPRSFKPMFHKFIISVPICRAGNFGPCLGIFQRHRLVSCDAMTRSFLWAIHR